ncbi:MAG TPA: aldo/keto reductase [Dactylosporangium sp.]|nr:aldo/keto reductase [Dactylosporangium sp.]
MALAARAHPRRRRQQPAQPRHRRDRPACNAAVAGELTRLAETKGISLSQLALAWLLAKQDYIVPIPGSRNAGRVAQNIAAADLTLTTETSPASPRSPPKAAPADAVLSPRSTGR